MTSRFKDIWCIAQEEKTRRESDKGSQQKISGNESHVFFMGSRAAGKTTLILRFLEREEVPKPTTGLEYTYGRKSRGADLAKDISHIWELGGGTFLSKLIEIPITPDTMNHLSIVIVIDLSKPEQLWDTIEILLKQVRQRLNEVLRSLQSSHPELIKTLKLQAKQCHGDDHPDRELLNPLLVPVVIIGSKYDVFQNFDPEKKKIISKTLRFLAHTNGASLIYYSNKSDSLISRVQQMITHFAFKGPISHTVSMDHNKPIIVPVGSDALGQIGVPTLSSGGDLEKLNAKSPFDLWKQAYCGFFPQISQDTLEAEDPRKDTKYKEYMIDSMRSQKDEVWRSVMNG